MLTAAEVEAMRETQSSALPDFTDVLRSTPSFDAAGGADHSWQIVASVGCRVHSGIERSALSVFGDRIASQASHTVTVPVGTDVQSGDRFHFGERQLEVVFVPDRETWHTAVQTACVEVT